MNLSDLPKLVGKSKRRVGRGHGSGRVKTAGRGTKGQNARGRTHVGFEGGQSSFIKRFPYLRGKGRNKGKQEKVTAIQVATLNVLPDKSTVHLSTLTRYHTVDVDTTRVKIIGKGPLTVALTVTVPISQGAAACVLAAGGTILKT